jgi:outer membrane protein assembly factor BamB
MSVSAFWRRRRRVIGSASRLLVLVVPACILDPTGDGKSLTGTPAEARWAVPSALAPTGSLVNLAAATESVYVVSGAAALVGHAASDGRVLWRRADVPTRMPLSVDDSMIVTLAAGPSAAVRARDGQVMWRTTIPGDAFAVMPIQVGEHALTANAAGDVFAVRLETGAVRQLGGMDVLAGARGQVWAFVGLGGDTALVVTQLETDQGRGAIVAARVLVSSGAYLGRAVLPFVQNEFVTTQAPFIQDSLVILPATGRVIAMDYRTGRRVWSVVNNSIGISVRNREVYSGSGTGTLEVLDAATGRRIRFFDIEGVVQGAITDEYACREGIFFTAGALWIIQNVEGARPKKLSSDAFPLLFPKAGTLYGSAPTREIALRCS